MNHGSKMLDQGFDRYPEPESYKCFKARKFEKTLTKMRLLVGGVHGCSLKAEDKHRLLEKMAKIISNQ
jgi:hypothetical protein